MERLVEWLARWQGKAKPTLENPMVAIFAGNHGVTDQGVSAFPRDVTVQMVAHVPTSWPQPPAMTATGTAARASARASVDHTPAKPETCRRVRAFKVFSSILCQGRNVRSLSRVSRGSSSVERWRTAASAGRDPSPTSLEQASSYVGGFRFLNRLSDSEVPALSRSAGRYGR